MILVGVITQNNVFVYRISFIHLLFDSTALCEIGSSQNEMEKKFLILIIAQGIIRAGIS